MQREMVVVRDRSRTAESTSLHDGFLAESRMKKRQ